MLVYNVNEHIFNEFLSVTDKTLVVVTAPAWCGPCKAMEPILHDIASMHQDDPTPAVTVMVVNFDDSRELAVKLGVQSVPTFIVYEGTEEKKRFLGAMPKEKLLQEYETSM